MNEVIEKVESKKTIEQKVIDLYEARKNLKLEYKVVKQACKRIPLDLVIDNVTPENFEKEMDKILNKTSNLSSSCRSAMIEIANAIYE